MADLEKHQTFEIGSPEDKYGSSCLILGFTNVLRPLHVLCSYPSRPFLKIITIYEPGPNMWINFKTRRKSGEFMKETMVETTVTYTLEHQNKFYLIENVPARVCMETGEQYFAPETVEHIQNVINSRQKPVKVLETPVFEYS